MKLKTIAAIAALIFAPMMLESCGLSVSDLKRIAKSTKGEDSFRDSEKWGKVIAKNIPDTIGVQSITTFGSANVNIYQSDSLAVKVNGNEKAIDMYEITIEDGNLTVKCKEEKNSNIPSITVDVYSPCLSDLHVNGASDVDFKTNYKSTDDVTININGAGDITMKDLECEKLNITINGAGDFDSQKITCNNSAEFSINGAGDLDAEVKANSVNTRIAGAGDASLVVNCNNLFVSCAGAGDVKLKGKCKNFSKSEGGMASIDSRELKYEQKK